MKSLLSAAPQWFEPKTYFGNITLKDVYEFQHLPEGVSQKIRSNFLGTQACLWSEFCECVEDAQYLIFPRLMAHSENAWAPQSALNWESFVERLDAVLEHLEVKGVQYARSMYNLDHKVTSAEGGGLAVNISCIRPDVEIRYTLKGAAPRSHDAQWSGEMIFDESTTIAAATFKDGKQMGQTLILPIAYNKATAKPVTAIGANAADAEVALLVNGVRGSDKPSDFEWCRWYRDDAGFIVDMQRVESISRVTLGAIMDHTLAVGMAKRIVVSASLDGEHYTALAEKNLTDEECFEQVIKTYDLLFAGLDTEARYLKVEFENPGKILEELPRAGQDCYVYFDEIIIE